MLLVAVSHKAIEKQKNKKREKSRLERKGKDVRKSLD